MPLAVRTRRSLFYYLDFAHIFDINPQGKVVQPAPNNGIEPVLFSSTYFERSLPTRI
jgi:hypothetical protein